MTASSVERSKSIAPFSEFARFGIRSWRRLSCTSICLKALMVWFLREISPLYAPTIQSTATATTTSRTHIIATPRFREVEPLRAVRQEFRDRLADGLRQSILVRAKAGERMIGIDVQLHTARDGDPSPGRRGTGFLDGIPCEPGGQCPSGTAARPASLIGVTADASRTAPTTTERSRRFQGARLRYSRRTCSGSACATIVMRPWLRSPDLGAVPPIPSLPPVAG